MSSITILGGGISGLSCGFELSKSENNSILVIEKEQKVGGVCGGFTYKNFNLDYGPHKIYSQLEGLMDYFKNIIGEDTLKIKKRNSLFLMNKYFNFPLHIPNLISNISPLTVYKGTQVGFSFIFSRFANILKRKKSETYEEHLIKGFGKAGYNLLFRDYAYKVWGPPYELTSELAMKRIPVLSISELLKTAVKKKDKPKISAEFFYYPKKGIKQVCENLQNNIVKNDSEVSINSIPTKISINNNKVSSITFEKDEKIKEIKTDYLVSTIHLNQLVNLIDPQPPEEVINAAKELNYKDLIVIYLLINEEMILKDNWIFFPGKEVIFNRVSEQKSFSKYTCPEGQTALMVEITCNKSDSIYSKTDKEILDLVLKDMNKVKLLNKQTPFDFTIKKMENIYPIYSLSYKKNFEIILEYLRKIENLYSIGRNGLFNYNNMDHCVDMSMLLAKHIINKKDKEEWDKLKQRFENYKIVD